MLNRVIAPLLFLVFAWFIVANVDARTIIAGVAIFLIGMHYMETASSFSAGAVGCGAACAAPSKKRISEMTQEFRRMRMNIISPARHARAPAFTTPPRLRDAKNYSDHW